MINMHCHKIIIVCLSVTLSSLASLAFAGDKGDEVCRFVYDWYYASYDIAVSENDSNKVKFECRKEARNIEKNELINADVVTLLGEAKVNPDNYRKVMAKSLQLACIENSLKAKRLTYRQFKQSLCGDFNPRKKK